MGVSEPSLRALMQFPGRGPGNQWEKNKANLSLPIATLIPMDILSVEAPALPMS